mgnify:CR=1 FL=1
MHLSQDAADLNSQESKDEKSKSEKSKSEKSKSEKSEKLVKKEPAEPPVDAFVHVIGHPDEQNSPKSASLRKDNLVIVDKPFEQSHSEVGIS